MYVLGIETSCDETAASVVKDGRRIFSNEISSSLNLHKKYGGVVPEIASRMHLQTLTRIVHSALSESKSKIKDISLVCVTNRPGLLGSLLVGISFAKSISLSLGIPLLGINHLHSHIYANFLDVANVPPLPFVALIISGGHTNLFYVKDFDKIEVLGQTLDDACGEAFDKVAKILGLGYPGGPLIERLGKKGNPYKIKFNCSNPKSPLDFSFSGIKTAVLYAVGDRRLPAKEAGLTATGKEDLAASFQEAVIDTLIKKSLLACRRQKTKTLVIGGGVAANSRLRGRFYQETQDKGLTCFFPSKKLCMDNAAMVAGLGYRLFKKGYKSDLSLNAELN